MMEQKEYPRKLSGAWFAIIFFREWSKKELLEETIRNPKSAKYIEMSLGDRMQQVQLLKDELTEVGEHSPEDFKLLIKPWLLEPFLPPEYDPNMLVITSSKALVVCESVERLVRG